VRPIWTPTARDVAASALDEFRRASGAVDYADLHAASIAEPESFWRAVFRFTRCRGDLGAARCRDLDRMPGAVWFPDASISFAENALARDDDATAIVARDESGATTRMTFAELRERVAIVAAWLELISVTPGDRVAAVLPNRIEAVIAMLATSARGAIWSACSPDFGADAIVDRFAQIAPKVVIGCDAYTYGGKRFDCRARLEDVVGRVDGIEHLLLVSDDGALPSVRVACTRFSGLTLRAGVGETFVRQGFAAPLYILFSSGTTGVPKCIVHGQGGTLLQHRKEHVLHCDVRRDERLLFFTTCGWMMWNWLVSALANGTTICLYDGSPFHPDAGTLFRFVEEELIDHFGVSPGFLSALAKADYRPRERHALGSLRSILSTGSPLPAAGFAFAHDAIAPVRVSSITGGTDIIGCFALGNPCLPVHAGEIQSPALGMDLAFLADDGTALAHGKGELVCRNAFPSMPIGFWSDPDGARFHASYFERFPGVWHHGDYGEFTAHGGVVIHGRSDAVLNRGGVRIGTAEIYRPLDALADVLECIAIGRERGHDLEILLFVKLAPGVELDADLEQRIRAAIRAQASPRHVPDRVIAVPDIPRTRSGKLVELAAREAVHGRPVKNVGALANPESLDHFRLAPAEPA
jgi:acetoacetyl-CoA synthetase